MLSNENVKNDRLLKLFKYTQLSNKPLRQDRQLKYEIV